MSPVISFSILLFAGSAIAASSVSVRSAKELVENLPGVLASRAAGECPTVERTPTRSDTLSFTVQRQCGQTTHAIGNYNVDKYTGAIRDSVSDKVVDSVDLRKLREELGNRDAQTSLTKSDAVCLLRHSSEGDCWSAVITVDLEDAYFGHAYDACGDKSFRKALGTRQVDKYTGIISDVQTGALVDSSILGNLRQHMVLARSLAELSNIDVKLLAESIPAVEQASRSGLIVNAVEQPALSGSHDVWFEIDIWRQPGKSEYRQIFVQVDIRNGFVRNPKTLEVYDSVRLRSIRSEALARATARKQTATEEVTRACSSK